MKLIISMMLLLFINNVWSLKLNEKEFIGIWNDNPIMAAGWGDCYQFYPNKSFRFNYSQMNSIKRLISYEGKYEIINNSVIFTVHKINIMINGVSSNMEPYGNELINGELLTIEVKNNIRKTYKIFLGEKSFKDGEEELFKRKYMIIANQYFWKMRDDPQDY